LQARLPFAGGKVSTARTSKRDGVINNCAGKTGCYARLEEGAALRTLIPARKRAAISRSFSQKTAPVKRPAILWQQLLPSHKGARHRAGGWTAA
jgi:hypothetical protein